MVFIKVTQSVPGMLTHACNPTVGGTLQDQEFIVNLNYIAS